MTVHIAYLADDQAGGTAGVRVVEPPPQTQQAQRGSFFAVVDLQGPPQGFASLTERLLSAMQRTYYSSKGTQSQVLVETVRSAQQLLQTENALTKANWRAGVICIGLMNDRLALVGMGDAFAFVTTDGGDVNVYPPDRLDEDIQVQTDPFAVWPLHRQKIDVSGAILTGGGRWLALVSPRTLAGATAYVDADTCQDAAGGLREQAGVGDIPGLLLVFRAEGNDAATPPPPPPLAPPSSSSPRPARQAQGGLPTALYAAPPITGTAVTIARPAAQMGGSAPQAVVASSSETTAPDTTVPLAEFSATMVAGAKVGLGRARELLTNMLPDRTPPASVGGVPAAPPGMIVQSATVAIARDDVAKPAPYVPPPRAVGGRARLFVAVAVIILLLVPAVVAGMYWQQGATNRAEAESLLDLGQARLLSAQDALDQADQGTAREMLTQANNYVVQGEEILGRTKRSSDLLDQIKVEQQQVMQIVPLYGLTQPLTTFAADADPQQVLVIDQDVYVLDAGKGQVIKYRMEATGESLSDEGQVVLAEGDTVDGINVGALVDISWQLPIPGYEDKPNLLVLDDGNHVFRYNQVDGAGSVSFGEPNPWKKATQLEVFSGRLYVADPGANQIYRYAPGTYATLPDPWFGPATQVSLQGAKVMRIDGDIWVLFDDGKVVRYHLGEQVPFGLDDSVALPTEAVDMYVAQSTSDKALYLADAAEERILFFDKETGNFLGQFQAAEGRPLRGLRSIFIDETRGTIFILTDEALYQQRLPR